MNARWTAIIIIVSLLAGFAAGIWMRNAHYVVTPEQVEEYQNVVTAELDSTTASALISRVERGEMYLAQYRGWGIHGAVDSENNTRWFLTIQMGQIVCEDHAAKRRYFFDGPEATRVQEFAKGRVTDTEDVRGVAADAPAAKEEGP